MKAQLRVLTGGPAGTTHVFSKSEVVIGRHPQCDLQFDPLTDLQVSVRHAMLVRSGDRWIARDLQSSNGTFVNGYQITSDTQLDNTDQIRLGRDGPLMEFRLVHEGTRDTVRPQPAVPPPRATDSSQTPAIKAEGKRESKTEQRVRVEVARQTKRLRLGVMLLALVLVGVLAGARYVTYQQAKRADEEVAALQARIDSVLLVSSETIRQLEGQLSGLTAALQQSQRTARDLQNQLEVARASGNKEQIARLTTQLASVMTELSERQQAAEINYSDIRQANQFAIGLVFVQYENGETNTGTAFAIRSDATMVTNRHVLTGDGGNQRISRMAVQFAESEQVFPAHLIRLAPNANVDLALIKVDNITNAVAVISGINDRADTISTGAPLAVIGFPFGTELGLRPGTNRDIATTTLTPAILGQRRSDQWQVHGFGAPGASGSPIFDATGQLVAVLYGRPSGAENMILAIPAAVLTRFLDE